MDLLVEYLIGLSAWMSEMGWVSEGVNGWVSEGKRMTEMAEWVARRMGEMHDTLFVRDVSVSGMGRLNEEWKKSEGW